MKIVIGADFVPTKSNEKLFVQGEINQLVDEGINSILSSASFSIFNLEVPLTNRETPIKKCGPGLIAGTESIKAYKALGVNFLTLANNHILDQGEQGVLSSIEIVKNSGIAYAGAGKNLEEASMPYVFDQNGKKIGIYCCTDQEFSMATPTNAGANPFDPLESFDHVSDLKRKCDYVIVLHHGGREHYRYPSPNLQRICRKFVEKGADLVVCQHSHCIGCEEKYQNGTIVYGQGNFLFDHSENIVWQTSLLIELDDNFNISYIPLVKDKNSVKLAKAEKKEEILDQFYARTKEITEKDFIAKKFNEMSRNACDSYTLRILNVNNKLWFKILNKLTGHKFSKKFLARYYRKNAALLYNILICDAHRDMMLSGLNQKF